MHTRIIRLSVLCLSLLGVAAWSPGQTPATRQVMREKLQYTQRILEAVMKSDFMLLEQSSEALSRMPEKPGWMVLNTPEYIRYSGAFVNATQELLQSAKDHDLDAAAVHYASMSMTCYQCHRYVKNSRIATLTPIEDEQRGGGGRAGQPPASPRPHPPATGAPRPPSGGRSGPPAGRSGHAGTPRGQIHQYPLLRQPDWAYRFPYDVYPYYRWGYPYPYSYPYFSYSWPLTDVVIDSAEAYGRLEFSIPQKTASVIVDGVYAGTVDEFDGGHHMHLMPGPHRIELEAPGFSSVATDLFIQPGHTTKYQTTMAPAPPAS